MAAKKKTAAATATVATAKKTTAKSKKSTAKTVGTVAVVALAAFGGHTILNETVPAYNTAVSSIVQTTAEEAKSTAESVEKTLSPSPTITIYSKDDLSKTSYDNLSVGVPSYQCDVILDRMGYALGYVEKTEQPNWVTYQLTAEEVSSDKAKRSDNFRSDPDVPTGSATTNDYKKCGYDRGHLAPAADMSFSVQAMSESFYMSNMSPQEGALNRGTWKQLEEWTRDVAKRTGKVYVVSGPIFYADQKVITVGSNEVAVPHAYYKVILDNNEKNPKAIGFILPNKKCGEPLSTYAVTVDRVEQLTGLDFFNKLPDKIEKKVEKNCDFAAWEETEK